MGRVSFTEFIVNTNIFLLAKVHSKLLLFGHILSSPACKIEVPERLTASHGALLSKGLLERCVSIPVRQATDEEILLAHRQVLYQY